MLAERFARDYQLLWANLSRFTGLLIILNISLFFLTEAVTKQGYYYTFYSLLFLAVVELAALVPLCLFDRLWYYCVALAFELAGIYFLVASVAYWVTTNRMM